LGLPADDILLLQRENIWYQALPVLLYLTAYSFMFLYGYFLRVYVAIIAWIMSPVIVRSVFYSTDRSRLTDIFRVKLFFGELQYDVATHAFA